MTPFLVLTGVLVVGGLGGVAWMLWPVLPERARPAVEVDHSGPTDVARRLKGLRERGSAPDDAEHVWSERQPMLPDEPRRVPWDFAPAERLPVLVTSSGVFLVPIASALLQVDPEAPEVLRGRRQGRAFHAVRLEPGLYLDLVEALRLLPVIGVELVGRGIEEREIRLFDDLGSIGASDDDLDALAPWLAGVPGPRVVPEGDGIREWVFAIAGAELAVKAWIPALAEGIREDRLRWAAVATWRGETLETVEGGATPLDVLERLVDDAPAVRARSLEAWRWSRVELAELAAVGHYLEEQEIPVRALLDDAFADGAFPMADLHDEAQSLTAAAVLNWAAVVHRRAGYPKRALGLLDAALVTCAPSDDDSRADIYYNRGYCRLQAALAVDGPEAGKGLPSPTDAQAAELELARRDFELASRLNPDDPHAWAQQAVILQLVGSREPAQDAWLQAATRTGDPVAQRQLLANADALRSEP
ncbi:MAG: hypothetical protein R3F61_07200 [Myxococcota bacterium]